MAVLEAWSVKFVFACKQTNKQHYVYIQTLKASEKLLDERIARLFVKFKNDL